ncbi:MAG TPA: DUF2012 domain-containing protein [Balneolales bacterium]|jgi:hypothetical protein|nr:DUF2012 domain-containing protein [Balneolales bacterium]
MKRLSVFCLAIFSVVLFGSLTAQQSVARNHQITINSDSTYTLTGTVVNAETNEMISDASVEVEDSDMSATTDDNGAFTIEGLSQGSYTLKISAEGYKESEVKVNVGDDSQKVIIKMTAEKTDDNK